MSMYIYIYIQIYVAIGSQAIAGVSHLVGWAHVGPPEPLWARPFWPPRGLMGRALIGLPTIYMYLHIYIYIYICKRRVIQKSYLGRAQLNTIDTSLGRSRPKRCARVVLRYHIFCIKYIHAYIHICIHYIP